jgi:ribosomal protein S27AE
MQQALTDFDNQSFEGYSRLQKGYAFEMLIQRILDYSGTVFVGNPRAYEHWLSFTNRGFDIKVLTRKNTWIKVECKLVLEPIFPSWFDRDWLSRDANLFVTNDVSMIPSECIDKAHRLGRMILTPIELLNYVMGNKYYLNNIPDTRVKNKIKISSENISENAKENFEYNPSNNTISNNIFNNNSKIIKEDYQKNYEESRELSYQPNPKTESKTETLMKNTRKSNNSLDQNSSKNISKNNKVNYDRSHEKKETRICPSCGKIFLGYGLRHSTRYFCSNCQDKSKNTIYEEQLKRFKTKFGTALRCARCLREFSLGDKYLKMHKRFFCLGCGKILFYDLPDSSEEMTYNFITPEGNTIPVTEVV